MSIFTDGLGGVTRNSSKSATKSNNTTNTTTKKTYKDKTGKSHIRDYYKGLAKPYGISEAEIDKNLSYNPDTKEISFYGSVLDNDYILEDGKSYYDTNKLDNIWNNTMDRLGYTKDPGQVYNENIAPLGQSFADTGKYITSTNDYLNKSSEQNKNKYYTEYDRTYDKINEYGNIVNENPFTGDTADAIYSIYGEKGRNAAGDAVASIAGSNSGNVDSYAQANARRQQLAFTNAASDYLLKNYEARMANAAKFADSLGLRLDGLADYHKASESQLGANAQNAYAGLNDNNRLWSEFVSSLTGDTDASKMNDAMINSQQIVDEVTKSTITGNLTAPLKYSDNELFENGKLINPDIDYEKLKQQAEAAGDTEAVRKYNEAIAYKLMLPEYQQFARYVPLGEPEPTRASQEFDINNATTLHSIDSNFDLGMAQLAAQLQQNQGNSGSIITGKNISGSNNGLTGLSFGTNPASMVMPQASNNKSIIDTINQLTQQTIGQQYIVLDNSGNYYVAPENQEIVKRMIDGYDDEQKLSLYNTLGLNTDNVPSNETNNNEQVVDNSEQVVSTPNANNSASMVTSQAERNNAILQDLNKLTQQTLGQQFISTDGAGNYYVAPENQEIVKTLLNGYSDEQKSALYTLLGLTEPESQPE